MHYHFDLTMFALMLDIYIGVGIVNQGRKDLQVEFPACEVIVEYGRKLHFFVPYVCFNKLSEKC